MSSYAGYEVNVSKHWRHEGTLPGHCRKSRVELRQSNLKMFSNLFCAFLVHWSLYIPSVWAIFPARVEERGVSDIDFLTVLLIYLAQPRQGRDLTSQTWQARPGQADSNILQYGVRLVEYSQTSKGVSGRKFHFEAPDTSSLCLFRDSTIYVVQLIRKICIPANCSPSNMLPSILADYLHIRRRA